MKSSLALLPDTEREDALWLAERVRAGVRSRFATDVKDLPIRATVSVGVASSNNATADLTGLLKAADQALYRAKEAGRNRVEIASYAAERAPLRQPDEISIHKRTAA